MVDQGNQSGKEQVAHTGEKMAFYKESQLSHDLYWNQCPIVNDMIQFAKETNFASIIESNQGNQQVLFQAMNNLLCRKPLGQLSDC